MPSCFASRLAARASFTGIDSDIFSTAILSYYRGRKAMRRPIRDDYGY
jgi:hypothetical protein